MARPLGLECENRVILGHYGITNDVDIILHYFVKDKDSTPILLGSFDHSSHVFIIRTGLSKNTFCV
jgi:hypothetical protein